MAACSLHALSSLRNSFNSRFNASSKPEATRPELRRQSSQLPKIPATQISTMARNVAPPGRLAEPVEFGQAPSLGDGRRGTLQESVRFAEPFPVINMG